jgi:hypothetical protein
MTLEPQIIEPVIVDTVWEWVNPNQIDLDTSQPKRFNPNNDEHVRNLNMIIDQLREVGQQYPVIVIPYIKQSTGVLLLGKKAETYAKKHSVEPRLFCIDGEKRTRGIRILGWNRIKAEKRYDLDFFEVLKLQLITCAKRIELNAADYSDAVARWIQEYTTKYPDESEKEAIKEIARITGYSLAYVHGRNLPNQMHIPKVAKRLIREEKLKINMLIEANRLPNKYRDLAIKVEVDKALRREEGEKSDTSPLHYRNIKHQVARLEKQVDEGTVTNKEKDEIAEELIKSGGKITPTKKDVEGNFNLYKNEALAFYDRVSCWNIETFTIKEMDELAGRLGDIASLFRNMQRIQLNVGNLKKVKFMAKNFL